MFYDLFLDLCRQRGLSPAAAAREMGLSNATTTHWAHGSIPSSTSLSKIANYFGVSTDYLKGNTDDSDFTDSNEPFKPEIGDFQFERFVNLCKNSGKKQSYLYELVGLPSKAGSNLRRTKKVKPEILEIWAKELNTSVAYLNGETDDLNPAQAGFRFDRLDNLLDRQNLTRTSICEEAGHADNYIRMFEKRNSEPPREFVNFCAQRLGTTSSYLYGETDDPSPVSTVAAPEQNKKPTVNDDDGLSIQWPDVEEAFKQAPPDLREAAKAAALAVLHSKK